MIVRPLPVRIFHWLNLITLWGMIGSGLQIYNANPVFGGREGWHLPGIFLLGGWLAGARNWHFTLMWIFGLNLLAYGFYVLFSQRWRHYFVQKQDLKALQASKNPQRRNFAWHRLAYTLIIPVLMLSIATGLAMYQPAQFYWLTEWFGDWQSLRVIHFLAVPTFIVFAIIHSSLALNIGNGVLAQAIFTVPGRESKTAVSVDRTPE
jgi:thiosulfate reductase cytochrome b subunit